MRKRIGKSLMACTAGAAIALATTATATATTVGSNVRVTHDQASSYVSADVMGGSGSYTDDTLARCGVDRRPQNEPTLAIDPRNPRVWTAGSNDYCGLPINGDAWTGYYRSTDGGGTWTDSLVPGYAHDSSPQAADSPLHQLALKGALAAGDPMQAWDREGRLFYMGNNFDRGVANGKSAATRQNFGSIWVTTYAPSDPADSSTDGARFVRTVLLATNVPGLGQFNDKTGLAVDPATGDVYAAWSDFHGSGCNEILFSRSTDHGATFSAPRKISSGFCGNQGPSLAVGPAGQLYIGWQASTGGSLAQAPKAQNGAGFVVSTDHGVTFTKARYAVTYPAFSSDQFSGDGSRDCGDPPSDCASGETFPRFDLAGPALAADNVHGTLIMGFPVMQPSGQGQVEYVYSTNGGTTWSAQRLLAPAATGHQFFPWLTADSGRVSAIWYDSRNDPAYSPTRAPCNDAAGRVSACINVRYASSTDGGRTWAPSTQLTNVPTNYAYEQFSGRTVPFFGDYIEVAAVGSTIGAAWTDQRDTVAAPTDADEDNSGDDVAGDPHVGGACTDITTDCFDHTGGLDQNIYAASITP